ncbi:hypothetical protein Tco_1500070 [Tanacetum coccineum]
MIGKSNYANLYMGRQTTHAAGTHEKIYTWSNGRTTGKQQTDCLCYHCKGEGSISKHVIESQRKKDEHVVAMIKCGWFKLKQVSIFNSRRNSIFLADARTSLTFKDLSDFITHNALNKADDLDSYDI